MKPLLLLGLGIGLVLGFVFGFIAGTQFSSPTSDGKEIQLPAPTPATPTTLTVTADVNNDGIADCATRDKENNVIVALSVGNGEFAKVNIVAVAFDEMNGGQEIILEKDKQIFSIPVNDSNKSVADFASSIIKR